jgi:hypothetical protein
MRAGANVLLSPPKLVQLKGEGWRWLTCSVLASADLDEALDVGDFLRHGG